MVRLIGLVLSVQVIINSVCPGLVSTNIARSIVAKSKIMAILVPIYLGALGKSADYGSRFYLIAALASQEQHVSLIINTLQGLVPR